MNLQENYKRLFKSKARSNDGSILLEARYNIKVADHRISSAPGVEGFRVIYNGTIAGPDIPNGTKFEAIGVAGDIAIPYSKFRADLTLSSKLEFPNATTAMLIYHANDDLGENEEDEGSQAERYYNGAKWPLAFMPKAKKDEVSKMIDDAVVKYALSKGLEAHVAEKSGGTFNKEVAINAEKNKTQKKRQSNKVYVDYGEVDGRDRTASGTYGNKKWELETDDGMTDIRIDGKPIDDDDPMYDAILTAVNDEGYELDLDEGITMNLQENYKRLFKGRARSNDAVLIKEAQTLKGKVSEEEFINWVHQHDPKAADEIQDIDTSMIDSNDLASEYFDILQKYKIPGTITDIDIDSDGYVSWIKIK